MSGLKRGSLVTLRSGGPEMVIERIDTFHGSPERYAHCKWFDKARLRSERFAVHVLELSSAGGEAQPRRAADIGESPAPSLTPPAPAASEHAGAPDTSDDPDPEDEAADEPDEPGVVRCAPRSAMPGTIIAARARAAAAREAQGLPTLTG